MSDALATFRANVARLMKDRGIRQAALAKESGIHQGNLSAYLSGKKEASVPVIDRIAKALGVTASELLAVPAAADLPEESNGVLAAIAALQAQIKTLVPQAARGPSLIPRETLDELEALAAKDPTFLRSLTIYLKAVRDTHTQFEQRAPKSGSKKSQSGS